MKIVPGPESEWFPFMPLILTIPVVILNAILNSSLSSFISNWLTNSNNTLWFSRILASFILLFLGVAISFIILLIIRKINENKIDK